MTYGQYCESLKNQMAVLARFFGWTFQTIENMTLDQIQVALEIIDKSTKASEDTGKPGLDGNLHFSTVDEWRAWRELRG